MPRSKKLKPIEDKIVAQKLMEQLETTGKVNITQAVQELKPHISKDSANSNGYKMVTNGVTKELQKLFEVKYPNIKDAINEQFVLEQLTYLVQECRKIIENDSVDHELRVKAMNSLESKLEKLGKYLGIWRQDKPQADEQSIDDRFDNLFNRN